MTNREQELIEIMKRVFSPKTVMKLEKRLKNIDKELKKVEK